MGMGSVHRDRGRADGMQLAGGGVHHAAAVGYVLSVFFVAVVLAAILLIFWLFFQEAFCIALHACGTG